MESKTTKSFTHTIILLWTTIKARRRGDGFSGDKRLHNHRCPPQGPVAGLLQPAANMGREGELIGFLVSAV